MTSQGHNPPDKADRGGRMAEPSTFASLGGLATTVSLLPIIMGYADNFEGAFGYGIAEWRFFSALFLFVGIALFCVGFWLRERTVYLTRVYRTGNPPSAGENP